MHLLLWPFSPRNVALHSKVLINHCFGLDVKCFLKSFTCWKLSSREWCWGGVVDHKEENIRELICCWLHVWIGHVEVGSDGASRSEGGEWVSLKGHLFLWSLPIGSPLFPGFHEVSMFLHCAFPPMLLPCYRPKSTGANQPCSGSSFFPSLVDFWRILSQWQKSL